MRRTDRKGEIIIHKETERHVETQGFAVYDIQRQLDGALSADTMAQEAEAKVDASNVVISH